MTAAIIGVSGYSGCELLRLLSARSDVRVTHLMASSSAGQRVSDLYPMFEGTVDAIIEPTDITRLRDVDIVFLALPSGEAMRFVPALHGQGNHIIDLGGDFRLRSASLYKEFYKHDHIAQHLLGEAVYGLPELNSKEIASAQLVANPGCYPTSAILALLPALKEHIISPRGIVINSLSGTTGAGRASSLELSFSEVNENIRAYKIGQHQHIPEIQSILELATTQDVSLSFVPHLVPMNRGIYTTIHADLQSPVNEEGLCRLYEQYYDGQPFVRIRKQIPQIKDIIKTNYCDITVKIEPRTNQLIIISVIDNLMKGAAGQAVQNMNIMFGLEQEAGLARTPISDQTEREKKSEVLSEKEQQYV